MATDGVIIKCIKGEEWPITSISSFVQVLDDPLTEASIILYCPVGHKFTLSQAWSKGIFTKGQVANILAEALRLKREHDTSGPFRYRASTFIPNKEVVALNLSCVRCGEIAERKIGPKSKPICLKCCADWFNYDKDSSDVLLVATWGRPYELLWDIVFGKFLNNMPPLKPSEAKELLVQCRREARRKSSKRSR